MNATTPSPSLVSDADKAKKKAFAQLKKDFLLHVGLIERQDGLAIADARATAYVEGQGGLSKRLGQKALA